MKDNFLPNVAQRGPIFEHYELKSLLNDKKLDEITTLAAKICNTPYSLINIIDSNILVCKSKFGIDLDSVPIEDSYCKYALRGESVLVIEDTNNSFEDLQPCFINSAQIKFYAGTPLFSSSGHKIGTLCVFGNEEGMLTELQKQCLQSLASQIIMILELRLKSIYLEKQFQKLKVANEKLEQYNYIVSHDLKTPVNNIISIAEILALEIENANYDNVSKYSLKISDRAYFLKEMINGILDAAKSESKAEEVNLNSMILEIRELILNGSNFKIVIPETEVKLITNKVSLYRVLQNLISNAIKHHHLNEGTIIIDIKNTSKDFIEILVTDDGPGINEENIEKIFARFNLNENSKKERSDGIGLYSAREIVRAKGGELKVYSKVGKGSTFKFSWPINE